MDEINWKILKILQEKARIPNVEVARQVHMAPSAVLERIRKLEKQGIIDGYEVVLNPERCGRSLMAFVQVSCRGGSESAGLGEALAAIADVLEVHYMAGEDGYMLKLRVKDAAALSRVLREQIQALPGVEATRTWVALETFKETMRLPLDDIQDDGSD
ncbi:MAG: Lrp/AsnC family transcriptional regulator [Bacteroidetes bacterium]|nr:MAG: Lrp/AsnC family transcriptional regulator [Bacteroidota bacterium]